MSTYLITQATGGQSRQVIKHLLAADAKIHAVVRDLSKVPADLKNDNVTLFQGESNNFDSIFKAAQGCKAVFLNTFPYPGLEALQAKTIVEASKKAGVESVVASTTITTNNKAMWDNDEIKAIDLHWYFTSKAEVEDIVRGSGLKAYTIVRPAVIHYDFFLPGSAMNFPRLATHAQIDSLLEPGRKLPYTDSDDIGRFAAAALLDPYKFNAQEIDLANEFFDFEAVSAILTRVSRREIPVIKRTWAELGEMKIQVFGQVFQLWGNMKDLSYLSKKAEETQDKFGIKFTSLEEALVRDRARLLEGLPAN